jgi:methylenetetrahydrofolate reductase (NADPH)
MPPLSLNQVLRMIQLSGSAVPEKLTRRLEAAGDNADTQEFVGIDWAITQIRDLLAHGAPGYHLYILNRAKAALALAAGLAA